MIAKLGTIAKLVGMAASLACVSGGQGSARIVLIVEEPQAAGSGTVPVTAGLPFPKGSLKSVEHLRLYDGAGRPIALQAGVSSRWWTDGSVRSAVLDFQAELDSAGKGNYSLALEDGTAPPPAPPGSVALREDPEGVDLSNDRLSLRLTRDGTSALRHVNEAGQQVLRSLPGSGLWLRTGDGTVYREKEKNRTLLVEERGPLRAAVKVIGRLEAPAGGRAFEYWMRFQLQAGQSSVRASVAFRYLIKPVDDLNDSRAGKWKPGLGGRIDEELGSDVEWSAWGWDIPHVLGAPKEFSSQIDGRIVEGRPADGLVVVAQSGEREAKAGPTVGKTFGGWVAAAGEKTTLAAGIRDAAPLFPKRLELTPELLRLVFWERPEGAPELKIRGGFSSRSHDVVLAFGATAGRLAAARLAPARAFALPEWYCATGWVNTRPYSPEKYGPYETVADRWMARALAGCPLPGEMHYGDTSIDRVPPWRHVAYGMTADLAHPLAVAFLRTGKRKHFEALDAFVRHVGVDNPVREVNGLGGLSARVPERANNWHASYFTAGLVLEPLKAGKIPGGGCRPFGSQCSGLPRINVQGLFDHYILTGDRGSLDLGIEYSNYGLVIAKLGLGRVGSDNGRTFRNWFLLLAMGYRVTGDPAFKEAALEFIRHYSKKSHIEVEKGWAYGARGDEPAKNQHFAWEVSMESPGIIRALHYFIQDTESAEAKGYLIDSVERYWRLWEKNCPDVLRGLEEGKEQHDFHRWAMVAPALAYGYHYSGQAIWKERARKAWNTAFGSPQAAAKWGFPGEKLDLWGYDMYVQDGAEYLPFWKDGN